MTQRQKFVTESHLQSLHCIFAIHDPTVAQLDIDCASMHKLSYLTFAHGMHRRKIKLSRSINCAMTGHRHDSSKFWFSRDATKLDQRLSLVWPCWALDSVVFFEILQRYRRGTCLPEWPHPQVDMKDSILRRGNSGGHSIDKLFEEYRIRN